VVDISAFHCEEETAHDTLEARSPVTSVRIKFHFVLGRGNAIKELSAVNSRYVLERAEWTRDVFVTSNLPRFSSTSHTKGYYVTFDGTSHSLNPLRHQSCPHHPILVPGDVLDRM
jgi:hypothetical protein